MTTHALAIAKASLAASFVRPDPNSISRERITEFHNNLDLTLHQSSASNIQSCKLWLLDNVTSGTRLGAVAKYLTTLSLSFTDTDVTVQPHPKISKPSSSAARRKQLAILYLVNDLLHHTKFHSEANIVHNILTRAFEPHLVPLFKAAAAYDPTTFAKHHRKIAGLLDIWESSVYLDKDITEGLRDITINPSKANAPGPEGMLGAEASQTSNDPGPAPKDIPFTLPQSHGESSTPFYDLPAGNLLPHIKPNSSTSIDPHLVRPLQLNAGLAHEQLIVTVKAFLEDVQALYSKDDSFNRENASIEFDELGQFIIRDETGEVVGGESYYGWSKPFCAKMKDRHSGRGPATREPHDYRRDFRGGSHRRQRSSSFESNESRVWTASRSSSRPSFQKAGHRREWSLPDDHAYVQQRHYRTFRRRSPSQSSSRSYSPPQEPSFPPGKTPDLTNRGHEQTRPVPIQQCQPALSQELLFGPGGMPIPPPPIGYTGPWPPPPPPPPPTGYNDGSSMHGNSFPTFPHFISPPNSKLPNSVTPFEPLVNIGFIPSGTAQQQGDNPSENSQGRLARGRVRWNANQHK